MGSRLHYIPADQLHLADLLDASGDSLQLLAGKQVLEDAACVHKGNDDDVARVGDLAAEQHRHDPKLYVPDGPAVDDRIPITSPTPSILFRAIPTTDGTVRGRHAFQPAMVRTPTGRPLARAATLYWFVVEVHQTGPRDYRA